MHQGLSIGVVVPCFNEALQVTNVISTMPEYVDKIIVVDDTSKDNTWDVVTEISNTNSKVVAIRHEKNSGVGAAIETGYKSAIEVECDLIVVMAGDGQMNPNDLASLIKPVAEGKAEYAKANRLTLEHTWDEIPLVRKFGNFVLSFLTRFATGYWRIGDSQTGYTVATNGLVRKIVRSPLYPRYGVPNDILIRCAIAGARVVDVPTLAVYNVGEQSKLKPSKVALPILGILTRGFFKRMWVKNFVLEANPIPLAYFSGLLGLLSTIIWTTRILVFDLEFTTSRLSMLILLLFCSLIMLILGVLLDVLFTPFNGIIHERPVSTQTDPRYNLGKDLH